MSDKTNNGDFSAGVLIGLFFGGLVAIVVTAAYIRVGIDPRAMGYREGQIDALNGNVKYETRRTADNELRWFEKGAK